MHDLAVLKSDGISPAALAFPLERPLQQGRRTLGNGLRKDRPLQQQGIFSKEPGRKKIAMAKRPRNKKESGQDLARGSEGEPSLQKSLRSL